MYFEKPYCEEDIRSLCQTRQPFRDANCFYRKYRKVVEIKERGGVEYVVIENFYGNGMHPATEMTMADAVRYLNNLPGLEFLPIYYY